MIPLVHSGKCRLCLLLCLALLCGLLAGCAGSAGTAPDSANDLVILTAYGDLHYPESWQEYVIIRQNQRGDDIVVTFSSKFEERECTLFEVTIGSEDGSLVGMLKAADGTQRNVYLRVTPMPENAGWTEAEENRFYAMQEDLNYLLDHLKK